MTDQPITAAADDPRMVRARELLQPFVSLRHGDMKLLCLAYSSDTIDLLRALIEVLEVHPAPPEAA